jgi:tetratricopeptide (TPR) repeat protein
MHEPASDPSVSAWPVGAPVIGPVELDALDQLAPEALTTGLPARLVGAVDVLLAARLDGHPWSQLLAAAACHDAYRGDPRALALFEAAWVGFEDSGDTEALGVAANVRANIALGHGDIPGAVQWWRRAEGLLGRGGDIAISAAAHGSLDAYAKGDLAGAEQRARDALLLADAAGNPGDSITPLVYLGFYAFCLGDFERASQLFGTAERVTASLTESRNERALVQGFSGVVEAVRGRQAEADRYFADGLAQAEADEAPWYAVMVRTLRADYTARWAPHRSLVDARQAQQDAELLGDTWWHGLARYSEGAALAELGDLASARLVLEEAVTALANPIERGFAQLELGEVLLGLSDRPAARAVLEEARVAFEGAGARYWATRASLAMGSADRDRGGRWLRLARSTAVADPAYDRLFTPSQELQIKVLGRPAVLLDGHRVEFLTRHAELATYLLAIAGAKGVSAEDLSAVLWPGVDDRRAGPRLRTLLWQVRNALGREAWRVQRRRGLVLLDLTGVDVDLQRRELARQECSAAEGLAVSGDGDRAAAPQPDGGGGQAAATTGGAVILLEGWDVTLPASLRTP